jgi:hypothetical protein
MLFKGWVGGGGPNNFYRTKYSGKVQALRRAEYDSLTLMIKNKIFNVKKTTFTVSW